jgi:hypothetical protein
LPASAQAETNLDVAHCLSSEGSPEQGGDLTYPHYVSGAWGTVMTCAVVIGLHGLGLEAVVAFQGSRIT